MNDPRPETSGSWCDAEGESNDFVAMPASAAI